MYKYFIMSNRSAEQEGAGMPQGYVRYPHIHQDRIIFVSEDDLWLVSSEGRRAERLTAGVDEISHPRFSPDGQVLAFSRRKEGHVRVHDIHAAGGTREALTYQS